MAATLLTKSSIGVVFLLVLAVFAAKKDVKLEDLLTTEKDRLVKNGVQCTEKQLRSVHSQRLKQPNDDATILCLIKALQGISSKDGLLWSALGAAFSSKGKKFSSQVNSCFKQAVKLSGKFPSYIPDWHFIGPFVIGKTEFDGDPVDAFGGIANISQFRMDDSVSLPSELVPHGKVKWAKVKQGAENKGVRVTPNVNWNDLVSSLSSMGITEWQGWVVGELAVNQDDTTILVQCLGVSTLFINGIPVTGDVYHRNHLHFAVQLSRGVHQVTIKLRTKVQAVFQCSFRVPSKGFQVLTPNIQPDLYDGYLFSQYLSIPITSHKFDRWLKVNKVSLSSQSSGESLKAELVDNSFSISPGQTRPIIVKLSSSNPQISEYCKDIGISLTIKMSEGQSDLPLTLRCRKKSESFLFTFLDHDGSVQHAAAIEPIGSCAENVCPTLLTLHGTTVPPQNQADSYKRMVAGEFQFGVQGMWLVAPTRHGAHNWEGPGALTAMAALESLAALTQQHQWIDSTADSQHVLFQGHSMGGHGAWHLATHFPDRAIGLAALAGWNKKEEYGDSNLFFRHDIATSHVDASVKAMMEACIGENDADRHVSNLWKVPVLCRVGGSDRTVHPFFSRRMHRLLEEEGHQVTFTELEGKEHWWWDTWETNDGGVVNDKQMRSFAATCLSKHNAQGADSGSCDADGCHDGENSDSNLWKRQEVGVAELVTVNPAFGEGLRGVKVISQTIPFRTSKIKINVTEDTAVLTTSNVQRFSLTEPPNRAVHWLQKQIIVDGVFKVKKEDTESVLKSDTTHFCRIKGKWTVCHDNVHQQTQRGPHTIGPARRIAEKHFVIVAGTLGDQQVSEQIQSFAVYIANLFFLTSDTLAPIVKDTDITMKQIQEMNVILLGGPGDNAHTSSFLSRTPMKVEGGAVRLGDCTFSDSRMGILTLAPNGAEHLALVLLGASFDGLADAVSLATPTIPPMTRSPFSNLLPDFVITGEKYRQHGPGGFLCAGFWGNQWEHRQELISCACGSS